MKKNLITTSVLLALPTLVSAQTEQTHTELQPINVYSAYAVPVIQDKTASSVTVLTEKDFSARNATYVSDVLKTVPSVALGISGGRGTLTSLFLRGANSNQTAVIIDGVKMKPASNLGFDFGGLSLSNIERIEVLRGEQSALWGSDAMGGVIYITTKSGLYQEKPFNFDFDLGVGSHGTFDVSATLSGYKQGFYYALHGDNHYTKGISALSANKFYYTSTTGTDFSTGGAVEKDKFQRDNGSVRIGYDDSNKGIEVLASHSSQTAHFDETYDRPETFYDDQTRTRETLFKLSGYLGNDQELLTHKVAVSQLKTDSDTFTTTNLYDPNTYAKIATVPSTSAYDAKKLAASYQLDVNFDREGKTTQAVSFLTEYQHASYNSSHYANGEKTLIEKSIAAEYRLFTETDHSISLSGRFTDNAPYQNAFTGRIAGAYRLSPNFRAHASLGSAIQNPTLIDYYGYFGTYRGNPELKPAKSLGGDVGLLMENHDKRHSLDITYFARNVKDFIASNQSYTASINLAGTTKVKGVEVVYNGKLTDVLTTYANYTFTQTKDSNNIELPRRPKHLANAGFTYQMTQALSSDLSVSYVGKRLDTYPQVTKLPSYTLVNLGVNYQLTENLTIYANLNNAFDKKYENILGYGQDGRNVYIGLKGSF
ncbi:TonB-dependent receptor plug domain-containing protein [Pasteurella oralis]|uniref:TonB-dependent receptor plug domain-containing protein n=1 Tax=Pasteurella oralis TaxID=1071947 RepID=UPI000C7E725E|nr:TonB-dependent receptor [Pasteurella oralis]